jgi:hypothetical protein
VDPGAIEGLAVELEGQISKYKVKNIKDLTEVLVPKLD